MDEHDFNCEDCDKGFDHEDEGYMSEAGFECHDCHDKRMDAEYADFIAWKAEPAQQIARNYPELAANVKRMEADPVGFYFACKNPGAGR
jgi:hypothetical protein